MKTKKIIIIYAVPLIMVFFFIRNVVLVETDHMDSWMGGGMRMFGKIDKMLYRVSGFNVDYNNKSYFVNFRNIAEFEDEDVESRILPNDERLSEILEKIKKHTWCFDIEADAVYLGNHAQPCENKIDTNQIENIAVYKIHYNPDSKKVNLELINDVNN